MLHRALCLPAAAIILAHFPFAKTAASDDSPLVIGPTEAFAHATETVTVEFTVHNSNQITDRNGNDLVFLNSMKDYQSEGNFTVVIFSEALAKFRQADIGDPAKHYRNQKVRVTGGIELRRGKPQIILKSPEEIAIVPGESDTDQPVQNVLFIAVDDLRPQLGCYGYEFMHTPNLDRLASEGRLFRRHFVQVPTCGASRCALLRGAYPQSAGDLSNDAIRIRMAGQDETKQPESLAHQFRRHGYRTMSIGKISHYPDGRLYEYDHSGDGSLEMPYSWDEVGLPYGQWDNGWDAFFGYASGEGRVRGQSPPFEAADVPDDGFPDGLIADAAIEALRDVGSDRFLLCVGFFKPHLPFCAPRKYFDLYDAESLSLSPNPDAPTGINPRSLHSSGEMFGNYRHDSANPQTDTDHHRLLRQAYFACVSYADAQVGRVLDELQRLGLSENTIVVVWGDHGWHLGDHSLWGKHSTFERALHSTLIVRTPCIGSPGVPADGLVETVDLYPTLTSLCDLPLPEGLDGQSLQPLLEDPHHAGKQTALGWWRDRVTVRNDRYRLVAYPSSKSKGPAYELFDHQTDDHETTNVAAEHPEVVDELSSLLSNRMLD